jgi:hypothetical protein
MAVIAIGKRDFSEYFGFPYQKPFIPPTFPSSSSSRSPEAVSRGLVTN